MFTICYVCKKQNDFWESRFQKEPVILNGQELYGAFTYSKYFCSISERKIKDKLLPPHQEKVLIVDCLNGSREEIREKSVPLVNS